MWCALPRSNRRRPRFKDSRPENFRVFPGASRCEDAGLATGVAPQRGRFGDTLQVKIRGMIRPLADLLNTSEGDRALGCPCQCADQGLCERASLVVHRNSCALLSVEYLTRQEAERARAHKMRIADSTDGRLVNATSVPGPLGRRYGGSPCSPVGTATTYMRPYPDSHLAFCPAPPRATYAPAAPALGPGSFVTHSSASLRLLRGWPIVDGRVPANPSHVSPTGSMAPTTCAE